MPSAVLSRPFLKVAWLVSCMMVNDRAEHVSSPSSGPRLCRRWLTIGPGFSSWRHLVNPMSVER